MSQNEVSYFYFWDNFGKIVPLFTLSLLFILERSAEKAKIIISLFLYENVKVNKSVTYLTLIHF